MNMTGAVSFKGNPINCPQQQYWLSDIFSRFQKSLAPAAIPVTH